jgi:hypothetical protein
MFFLSTRQQIYGSAAIRILIEKIRIQSGRYIFSPPVGVFFKCHKARDWSFLERIRFHIWIRHNSRES